MATKDSPLQLPELSIQSEESDTGSDWDNSEKGPDYDLLEETQINFSNLSLKKAKARIVKDKGLCSETAPEAIDVTASFVDEEGYEKVQKIIEAGLLEKLKVDECKVYLRKHGLRLTGNKDTLLQRIKEHLEILNGGGEKKYPRFSFVLNCKGDACTGDVVLFEQNVYEMFNIASRSASGPPCGKRIVAGRIVKESYGAAKQQHTFTIEVLWSKGEKPLPPLYPLLIKGRNLYRLKTLRQKWEDEAKRLKILMEKHSRGSFARADREARIQEKEKRKTNMENRVSKQVSVKNQCQSHSHVTMSPYQPQERNVSINPEKSEFPSQNSGLSANIRKEACVIVNKPAAVTEQHGMSFDSKTVAMRSDQLASSGRTSFTHHIHNQQTWKHPSDYRSTFAIDHMRGAELGANYNYVDLHSREKPTFIEKNQNLVQTTWKAHHMPLANANQVHPLMPNRSYKPNQLCRHYSRGWCRFGDNCKFLHDFRGKRNA
ncbi:zinc finger CCCH domain-containing protein 62-like [Abrus precatorius]|uniref:Zinc finger CCCH domain-containing protein 62-like n=1 Tax=Abrus precatorius TaxID=3816 RepID=A0A8B8K009_ABRPR|nr:zinc finger CCCH domain-containing protein 62-like [Abrus precatorius]